MEHIDVVRVLLVDDDEDVRFMARVALELGGICVVGEGSDGREAIDLAEALQPDVVLLDLEMPWLHGAEAVPYIRRAAPDAVIIIWTAAPDGPRASEAVLLGAATVMDKAQQSRAGFAGDLLAILARVRSSAPAAS